MLEKDVIPRTEPQLRVGIVMPEDHFTEITLSLPSDNKFLINTGNDPQRQISGERLHFKVVRNTILLNNSSGGTDWVVSPSETVAVAPKSGIKAHSIIAGRGFHWQKHIDVFLPGSVRIRLVGERLILINELPLEDYLMCVATSEMGQACPEALIEAQTIVARSWMLANVEQKHRSLGMDVCNDDCCQRYQGTANLNQHAINAAGATRGQVILYNDMICDARYSKSCGGMMESFATVWGGEELPYLKNIPDFDQPVPESGGDLQTEEHARTWINSIPYVFCSSRHVDEKQLKQYLGAVDEDGTYFRWNLRYTQTEICSLLNEKINLQAIAILDLIALERGGSGRIKFLKILYIDQNAVARQHILSRDVAIRGALHHGFLYSSCIYIDTSGSRGGIPQEFVISGAGWGHGVGLCQIGALGMALSGNDALKIVNHYYPGSNLEKIYP